MKLNCKLQIGDVILTADKSCISEIIRWWTISKWSHAGVVVQEGDVKVFEATFPRVRIVDLQTFLKKTKRVVVLRSKRLQEKGYDKEKMWNYINNKVGKKYDLRGLLSFVLRKNVQNKSWYFCSELVAEMYKEVFGIEILRKEPNWMTPQDLWESIEFKVHYYGQNSNSY